ncbi:hypothetical protein RvY_08885 [Ramazzottius varieornatus]|uniref:Uncharacterized protein n=1 Tax=Ramazzottius varieornatus TaxID=947166 RepID=A0A1D1V7E6_RAMVA|nr:hypothetical protein RvY_08885 [Ramazzottius varieornatus]
MGDRDDITLEGLTNIGGEKDTTALRDFGNDEMNDPGQEAREAGNQEKLVEQNKQSVVAIRQRKLVTLLLLSPLYSRTARIA